MNIKTSNGNNKDGFNILIISGVHGNELSPIYSTYLLNNYIQQHKIGDYNSLTIITGVSNNAIIENSRDLVNSHTNDLNRMFSNFNINEKELLKEYIDANDIIIDIHSSPNCTEFVLINQDENANSYVEFCKEIGVTYLLRYSNANTIKKFCLEKGKICFTLELNLLNYIDLVSSEKGVDIIINIINNINKFDYRNEYPVYNTYGELNTYYSGIFIPKIKCGTILDKGDYIGDIIDLDSLKLYPVLYTSNVSAMLICLGSSSYVDASHSIGYVQPI